MEKVISIIATELGKKVEEVTEDKKLTTDLNADELNIVNIVMTLEDEYPTLDISEEDMDKFVTVKNVVDYVQENTPSATV